MSDFWKAFHPSPFAQFDAGIWESQNKAAENIEHLPITTRKGRVIYNRKPHLFDEKDLLRVSRSVLTPEMDPKNMDFERLLMEITIWMTEVILDRISFGLIPDETARNLYNTVWNFLNGVIKKLSPEQVSSIIPTERQDTGIV